MSFLATHTNFNIFLTPQTVVLARGWYLLSGSYRFFGENEVALNYFNRNERELVTCGHGCQYGNMSLSEVSLFVFWEDSKSKQKFFIEIAKCLHFLVSSFHDYASFRLFDELGPNVLTIDTIFEDYFAIDTFDVNGIKNSSSNLIKIDKEVLKNGIHKTKDENDRETDAMGLIIGVCTQSGILNCWQVKSDFPYCFSKPGDSGCRVQSKTQNNAVTNSTSIGMLVEGQIDHSSRRTDHNSIVSPLKPIIARCKLMSKIHHFRARKEKELDLTFVGK